MRRWAETRFSPTWEEQRECLTDLWAALVRPYHDRRAAIPQQHRTAFYIEKAETDRAATRRATESPEDALARRHAGRKETYEWPVRALAYLAAPLFLRIVEQRGLAALQRQVVRAAILLKPINFRTRTLFHQCWDEMWTEHQHKTMTW